MNFGGVFFSSPPPLLVAGLFILLIWRKKGGGAGEVEGGGGGWCIRCFNAVMMFVGSGLGVFDEIDRLYRLFEKAVGWIYGVLVRITTV